VDLRFLLDGFMRRFSQIWLVASQNRQGDPSLIV
jgi:hypothetical protein